MNAAPSIRKHVDVFLCDVLVASYPIVLPEDQPVSDQDFIEAAIEQMRRGGSYDSVEVARARFMVRAVEL